MASAARADDPHGAAARCRRFGGLHHALEGSAGDGLMARAAGPAPEHPQRPAVQLTSGPILLRHLIRARVIARRPKAGEAIASTCASEGEIASLPPSRSALRRTQTRRSSQRERRRVARNDAEVTQ